VLAQKVLNQTLPHILLTDTLQFPEKLNFTADRVNIFMVKKALLYLAAGKQIPLTET
jgi:hypothetical protein